MVITRERYTSEIRLEVKRFDSVPRYQIRVPSKRKKPERQGTGRDDCYSCGRKRRNEFISGHDSPGRERIVLHVPGITNRSGIL